MSSNICFVVIFSKGEPSHSTQPPPRKPDVWDNNSWVPIRKVQQCAMIFRCIKLPACLGFVDPAVFAIWARA